MSKTIKYICFIVCICFLLSIVVYVGIIFVNIKSWSNTINNSDVTTYTVVPISSGYEFSLSQDVLKDSKYTAISSDTSVAIIENQKNKYVIIKTKKVKLER
jgi:hypothetical protein